MKQILALILIAFAGVFSAPLPVQAQLLPELQTHKLDGIVAVVEDDVILQSELDRAVATVKTQFQGDAGKLPPDDVLHQQVLDRLILQRLQVQRASDMGIRVTQTEVTQATSSIAEQNQLTSSQMISALADQGMSLSSFQRQVADQIIVEKLRQQVLQQQVHVTDSEIDNLLNSPTFQAGEVHLAHITVTVPQGASADDIAAAKAKADEVEKALASGLDFNAAAIRYSQASDALEGGDLGWRSVNEIPPQFASLLTNMKDGEITPPLRDATGFHIIKLLGSRDEGKTLVTEFHARHIMVKPDALTTDAQAKAKVEALRKQIVDDKADFAKLAKADSDDDTTANVGGDMGWFPLDGWGTVVAQQIKQLKDNELSQPFHAGEGWHILQLLGSRQQDRTTEVLRDRARQAIENRKSEDVYNNFLRELRAQAFVQILIGDKSKNTGASQAP